MIVGKLTFTGTHNRASMTAPKITASGTVSAIDLTAADVIQRKRCPVCGGVDAIFYVELVFRSTPIPYQRCRDCDLVFMNPVPNQAWYDRLYGQAFWETKSTQAGPETMQARQTQLIKQLQRAQKLCAVLDRAGRRPAPGARILEIGCAFGLIVSTIAERYQAAPFGVEPSELAASFAETLGGVEIIAPTIEQLSESEPDQPMDMIMFSHVMENVVDLSVVFRTLERWLAPNGIVLMETPNSTVKDSTHIYHPYCFSRMSLRHLFDRNGYEIISLDASGRPSSAIVPRYLTLVAIQRTEAADAEPPSLGDAKSSWKRRFGHGWRRTVNHTPLVHFDRALTKLLYAPDAAVKQRANELAQAHIVHDASNGEISQP